jgi:hypothetical protein
VAGLFFEEVLLPQGWARDVRMVLDQGRLSSVEAGVSAQANDERHGVGLPGMAHRARNVVAGTNTSTGRTLFEGALKGGSQALGVATSGLTEGGFADIVSLDAGNVALAGRSGDAIPDSWIFGIGRSLVDCVWARGHKVVQDGRHHARETIALRFRQTLQGLLAA